MAAMGLFLQQRGILAAKGLFWQQERKVLSSIFLLFTLFVEQRFLAWGMSPLGLNIYAKRRAQNFSGMEDESFRSLLKGLLPSIKTKRKLFMLKRGAQNFFWHGG